MSTPSTLETIKLMPPGLERVEAIAAYLRQSAQDEKTARDLRDEDLALLAAQHGKAPAARLARVSLSTIKIAVAKYGKTSDRT